MRHMGSDPYKGDAKRSLQRARSGQKSAERDLGRQAGDPKAAKRAIESAQADITRARTDARSAVSFAQEYVDNAQHDGKVARQEAEALLEEARALQASLNDAAVVVDVVVQNSRNAASKQSIREVIERRATDRVVDDLSNSLLAKLYNYATYYKIEWLVSIFTGLPPGAPAVLNWGVRAAREASQGFMADARRRYANENEDGSCISPLCHRCQQGLSCQYL